MDTLSRIIKLDKIDVCKIIADVESYTPFRHQLDVVNTTLKGSVHKCPYRFLDINGITFLVKDQKNAKQGSIYPNGHYTVKFLFWSRNKLMGMLTWDLTQNL